MGRMALLIGAAPVLLPVLLFDLFRISCLFTSACICRRLLSVKDCYALVTVSENEFGCSSQDWTSPICTGISVRWGPRTQ
ncbi:hypothetical protein Taro_007700 [Colocasia esculenta]|uniref:Uncharacterized protein n=1 Tax=Colocasia esculenta TaxID=4460 RepID=A0A843TRY5_COLES|nr:hypothetical protein [Colocasia esculenta]